VYYDLTSLLLIFAQVKEFLCFFAPYAALRETCVKLCVKLEIGVAPVAGPFRVFTHVFVHGDAAAAFDGKQDQ
jgi:hypothetical protein